SYTPKRGPLSRASGVDSCTVSSSLPIPARNKQAMQPSPPLGFFSSTPPQVGQVEAPGGAGCISQTTVRPRRGTSIAVLRLRLPFQTLCRARLRVESRDNVCVIGQHRCAMSRLADVFVRPSVHTGSPILRWLKDKASNG